MQSRKKRIRSIGTHLLVMGAGLGLGMAVWTATHKDGDKSKEAAANETTGQKSRASTRTRDREDSSRSGTEILKAISPHSFADWTSRTSRGTRFSMADHAKQSAVQVQAAADALAPADDVAAAAMSLLEEQWNRDPSKPYTEEEMKLYQELQPRLLHWLRADPETALREIFKQENSRHGYTSIGALFAIMQEKGFEAASGWLKNGSLPMTGMCPQVFAGYVASLGDVANLNTLKATLDPSQWQRMSGSLLSEWPFEKADELISFATANKSPDGLIQMARRNGKEGADWLMKHLNGDTLDPSFKEAMLKSPAYRQFLQFNSDVPLETRLEVLAKNRNDGKDAEQIALELGGTDVTRAMNQSMKDLRFAFKNGKVSFEEVYEAIAADLPELAKASPDAIRLQVFKELAEEDGAAAMQALANTPEPDRTTLAYKPTQWMFYNVDPQKFYDYLQVLPHQDPIHHQARLESWVWHTRSNMDLYSRDYVDWVKNMPEGIDREMAAIGILRAAGGNTALKEEVDQWVTSSDLRARIQAPPPDKK